LDAANGPTKGLEVNVHRNDELLAASFFDVGKTSVSSIYGIFEPAETSRSLGIFTMLVEIKYALENGKQYYYPGYAYEGESYYDYKKRFAATEVFDWNGNWTPYVKIE
jgi:arginine-tRNA-protein transferase